MKKIYRLLTDEVEIPFSGSPYKRQRINADAGAAICVEDGDPRTLAEFSDEQAARNALKAYTAEIRGFEGYGSVRCVRVTSYWIEKGDYEIDEDGDLVDPFETVVIDFTGFGSDAVRLFGESYRWTGSAWEEVAEE